ASTGIRLPGPQAGARPDHGSCRRARPRSQPRLVRRRYARGPGMRAAGRSGAVLLGADVLRAGMGVRRWALGVGPTVSNAQRPTPNAFASAGERGGPAGDRADL